MGFWDADSGAVGSQYSILTPEIIQELDAMGIPTEQLISQMPQFAPKPPNLSVADTLNTDPLADVDPSPTAGPEVGVNPPDTSGRDTWYKKLLGGLGDTLGAGTPMGESLMSFGAGVLGAQNTYGSTFGALGQGGQAAVNTYGYAKRREQIDQYKKDQTEAAKIAARDKRIQSVLSQAKELSSIGRYDAANKLISANPEVLEELHLNRGEVLFGPKTEKPATYVNKKTGRVWAYSPDGGVTLVGQVDAEPDLGPDPYTGMTTERIFNPETGRTEVVRFDRQGNRVATLGEAPPTAKMRITANPEGGFTIEEGATDYPAQVKSAMYSRVDAANSLIEMVDAATDAIHKDPSAVGLSGATKGASLGAVGQLDAMTGGSIKRFISQAYREAKNAKLPDADVRFSNENVEKLGVLGDAIAVMTWKMIEENPRGLTDSDMKRAAELVSFGRSFGSPDQLLDRLKFVRELAVKRREGARARIDGREPADYDPQASGNEPAPKSAKGDAPAPTPAPLLDRTPGKFNAPPAGGTSRDAQAAELEIRNKLARAGASEKEIEDYLAAKRAKK